MKVYTDRNRCALCGRFMSYGVTETTPGAEATHVCCACVMRASAHLMHAGHSMVNRSDAEASLEAIEADEGGSNGR